MFWCLTSRACLSSQRTPLFHYDSRNLAPSHWSVRGHGRTPQLTIRTWVTLALGPEKLTRVSTAHLTLKVVLVEPAEHDGEVPQTLTMIPVSTSIREKCLVHCPSFSGFFAARLESVV